MPARAGSSASVPAQGGGALTSLTSRLRAFLLVFGVIHACQLTNRLYDLAFPGYPSYLLYLLQSALAPLQGLGNAIGTRPHDANRCATCPHR